MKKEDFMNKLTDGLNPLPQEEREQALTFYKEYFAEAGPDKEQEVLAKLKSPSVIAQRILAEQAVKDAELSPASPKKQFTALWFLVLTIFAAPVALPLLLAIVLPAFIITLVMTGLSLASFIVGCILIGAGIWKLFTSFAVALMLIGCGLVLAPLAVLTWLVCGFFIVQAGHYFLKTNRREK